MSDWVSGSGHPRGYLVLCQAPFTASSLQGSRWRREGSRSIKCVIITFSCTECRWAPVPVPLTPSPPHTYNGTRDPQEGTQSGLVLPPAAQAYLGSGNGRCQAQQVVGGSGTSVPLGGWGYG